MLNRKTLLLTVVSGSIMLSGLSAMAGGKGDAKAGKKVFETNCASCHGLTGKGDGAVASALNPKPRNFVEAKFKYGSDDASLFKTISAGKGVMPPWKGILSDKQINDVIAHVRTLKKK